MAIFVESSTQERGPKLTGIVVIIVIIFLIAATYFLFFAPAPLIDVITPSGLQSISKISESGLNTSGIFNSSVYQSLKEYVSAPEPGALGRGNPFQPF